MSSVIVKEHVVTVSTLQRTRWQEILVIWQDNRWLFTVAGWLLGMLTLPLLQYISLDISNLLTNLVPEAIGIVFTVLILDRLAENRAREQLQTRLIQEARSQSNETAKAAVDWMNAEGWLKRDSQVALLKGANLTNAKLGDADLRQADLQHTDFWRASLQHAHLRYANLQYANLNDANLRDAHLRYTSLQHAAMNNASLQHAYCEYANLQHADLTKANLKAATLYRASLRHAKLDDSQFDEKTILPDAQRIQNEAGELLKDEIGDYLYDNLWTPQTDMRRYTDPEHSDFWQPDYMASNYQGADKPWWV
jgi:hypothetical protein